MENKCSAIDYECSTNVNYVTNLQRSLLNKSETLSLWKATTGQIIEWKPRKHSGLCVVDNGKGAIKSTAVSTSQFRTDFMEYSKKKSLNMCSDEGQKEKLLKDKPVNIEYQLIEDSYLNKIKALKMKKRRYTKEINLLYSELLKKKNLLLNPEMHLNVSDNDLKLFAIFIDSEMKKLKQNKKVYLTAKFKIQKVLTKGLLKALKSEI